MAQLTNYSSSQDLSNGFRENWSPTLENFLGQYNVSAELCGKVAEGVLAANGGDSYNYLTVAEGESGDINPYTEAAADDATVTVDLMVLNLTSEYKFKQEEDEKGLSQTYESFFGRQGEAALKAHNKDIDGNFFAIAFQNAENVFDEGDVIEGGSAGTPVTIAKANIDQVAYNSQALISESAQEGGALAFVGDTRVIGTLGVSGFANGASVSDRQYSRGLTAQLNNGHVGGFFGLEFYQSLFIPHAYKLTYTGQPADTETMVIGGITLTMVATLTGGDGEVLIGADEDATYTNLVALLNNPSGSTATYKGFTINSASHKTLRKFAGKLDATAGVATLISKAGRFTTAPTEALGNATMGSTQLKYIPVTLYGAIELAKPRGVRFNEGKNDFGTQMNYSSRVRYGVATPTNDKKRYAFIEATA